MLSKTSTVIALMVTMGGAAMFALSSHFEIDRLGGLMVLLGGIPLLIRLCCADRLVLARQMYILGRAAEQQAAAKGEDHARIFPLVRQAPR